MPGGYKVEIDLILEYSKSLPLEVWEQDHNFFEIDLILPNQIFQVMPYSIYAYTWHRQVDRIGEM